MIVKFQFKVKIVTIIIKAIAIIKKDVATLKQNFINSIVMVNSHVFEMLQFNFIFIKEHFESLVMSDENDAINFIN